MCRPEENDTNPEIVFDFDEFPQKDGYLADRS
jgi:hypothetical protein